MTIQQCLHLLPSMGIGLFVLVYVYASGLYPGGSPINPNSAGFDWVNNYWCNLVNARAINGLPNPARPFALGATAILCASLGVFFWQFAELMMPEGYWKGIVKYCGVLTMVLAMCIFTPLHDSMIAVASLAALLLLLGIAQSIHASDLLMYKLLGLLVGFLLILCNVLYYTEIGINWLPLLQKLTCIVVLIWVMGLNIYLLQKV